MKATPLEQLRTLMDIIAKADDKSMLLNFKAGKQKTTVESPIALRFLVDAIKNQTRTMFELHINEFVRSNNVISKEVEE